MALSKELEEELMCPIDLEYNEEPMQLKCLHLLCEKDVNYMIDSDGLIQCPVCNRVSEKRDIKKDFRTKRLIELIKGVQLKRETSMLCESCGTSTATCRCRECKLRFCDNCREGHLKVPILALHRFDTIHADDNGVSFADLSECDVQASLGYRFRDYPWSFAAMETQIWVVMNISQSIEILHYVSDKIEKLKRIYIHKDYILDGNKHRVTYVPGAVTFGCDLKIAVCCGIRLNSEEKHQILGLVAINENGLIQEIIAEGRYSDVKADDSFVYGLRKNKFLTIHKRGENNWNCMKIVSTQTRFDRLCLFGDIIVMTDIYKPNTVTKYDKATEQFTDFRIGATMPRVSTVDKEGKVCICDSRSGRVIVLLLDGTSRDLKVKGKVQIPRHVAIGQQGKLLVLCEDDKSIQVLA